VRQVPLKRASASPATSATSATQSASSNAKRNTGFGLTPQKSDMILVDVLDKVKMLTSIVKEFSVEQLDLRLQVSKLQQQQHAIEKIVTTNAPTTSAGPSPAPSPSPSTTQTPSFASFGLFDGDPNYSSDVYPSYTATTTASLSPIPSPHTPPGYPTPQQQQQPPFSPQRAPSPFLSSQNAQTHKGKEKQEGLGSEEELDVIETPRAKKIRTEDSLPQGTSSALHQPLSQMRQGPIVPLRRNRFADFSALYIPFCIDDANKPFTVAKPMFPLSASPSLANGHNKLARVIVNEGFCKLLEYPQVPLLLLPFFFPKAVLLLSSYTNT